MKTLFITAFQSFISKNILNTDVLKLIGNGQDLRVVIFVPKKKASFFEKYYGGENILVEGIDIPSITKSKTNTFFHKLFFLMIDSHYIWYKREDRRNTSPGIKGWIKYYYHFGVVKILSKMRFLNPVVRYLSFYLSPKNLLNTYFEQYQPSLVFSTDVFDQIDAQFLKESKSRHVPTLGMVRSWDNCYSKGLLSIIPNKLLSNNELIKDELITLHDVSPKDTTIVGCPQFDSFVTGERTSRESFFESIGVDPEKKLVVFAPAGAILSDTDWQMCEILDKAREEGKFTHPVHFFVRNHPGHPADLSRFKKNSHFTIQDPGHVFDAANPKTTELDPNDQKFLADLLFHSDLVMYVATSLSLDATVYDKPQIMIDFDGYEIKEYTKSVKRYHDEDHMKKLIATDGVRVAHDKDELIASINAYLDDPHLDNEGRNSIVKEQLYRIDGKSSERIVVQMLKHLT